MTTYQSGHPCLGGKKKSKNRTTGFPSFGFNSSLAQRADFIERYSDKMHLSPLLLLFLNVHSSAAGDNSENH